MMKMNNKITVIPKIKSIQQRLYNARLKYDEIIETDFMDYDFDKLEEKFCYYPNYNAEFDKNSNLILLQVFNVDKETKKLLLCNISKYIYDEKNRLVEEYKNGSISKKNNYKDDLLEEELEFDRNGNITKKTIPIYDENRLTSESKEYNKEGLLEKFKKYEYYETLKLWKETIINSNGFIDTINEHNYHENGRILICNRFSYGKKDYFMRSEFDKNNLLINSFYDTQLEEHHEYNEHHLSVKTENRGDTITHSYIIDDYGNWIKRISYRNEIAFKVKKREITYYQIQ